MQKYFKSMLAVSALSVAMVGCTDTKESNSEEMNTEYAGHGIDVHYMDKSVSPRDDFYNYVNGTWMKETEIPSDQKSWGSFYMLRKRTDDVVLEMLNDAIKENNFGEGSDQSKAILLYHSQLNKAQRDKDGFAPVLPVLESISEVNNFNELQHLINQNPDKVANPFYGMYASSLPENSAMNGAFLYPGSLGLPDRDYYTNEGEAAEETRTQYLAYITKLLTASGIEQKKASADAQTILALETQLATPRMTKEKRRDATLQNNPKSLEEISKMTPAIDWEGWINNLPVKIEIDTIIITQLDYMVGLQEVLSNTTIEDLKTLVAWHTLNNAASSLSVDTEYIHWEFYSKTLEGTPEQRPAEERALGTVNGLIGEALGQIYVERNFPKEAKETVEEMVADIIQMYKKRVENLDWMSDDTKVKALEKLNSFTVKIGYPDKWKDYSEMDINKDNSFYDNMVAAGLWRYKENLAKINQPVDRDEWYMSPQTVNAYYNPTSNEIVFPAAILQPPFFDYQADAAVNFGGIGAVIGHEITHGFDDSGAKFDAEGNLKNWWTEEDLERFTERTQQLSDYYSAVEVEEGLHLNGAFTLGENTADLGGVLAAYDGLQLYYEHHDKPGKIDGLTQEQRFFVSWATVWRTKTRAEALRTQIQTDPHAPGYYRAYLPLLNIDAFHDAFGIKKGDAMYVAPEDRIRIW